MAPPPSRACFARQPVNDPLALALHQTYPAGTLYVVATPIGNVADVTLRALHLLTLADRIAAEDTRLTAQLLARYGIVKPAGALIAAHEHNERAAAERIVAHLRDGERIAYVSDAGTPGLSDPGARLVDAVRVAGLGVVPLPGASALTTALSVAGDWAAHFTFIGFLPAKAKQREAQLLALRDHRYALVFYEAPHRIRDTLIALRDAFGAAPRRLLIARELTKLHETLAVCPLAEGPDWLDADPHRTRGEFVLMVEGAPAAMSDDDADLSAHDALLDALLDALPVSAAAKVAAQATGIPRDRFYARALERKKQT